MSFYVAVNGKKRGLFSSDELCLVKREIGEKYVLKSFATRLAAQKYLNNEDEDNSDPYPVDEDEVNVLKDFDVCYISSNEKHFGIHLVSSDGDVKSLMGDIPEEYKLEHENYSVYAALFSTSGKVMIFTKSSVTKFNCKYEQKTYNILLDKIRKIKSMRKVKIIQLSDESRIDKAERFLARYDG